MSPRAALLLVAALLAPGAAIAKSAPPPAPPHATAIAGAEDLDAMRAAFNASADSLRIVLLLSPSSGACVNAAAAVESLLERHPQAQAVVFAVWQRALWTDWHAPEPTAPSVLTDRRVRRYWDPGTRVSRAILKTRPREPGPRVWIWGTLWDYVAVIPPGVRWDGAFPETEFSGGPIGKVIDHIENRLKPAEAD